MGNSINMGDLYEAMTRAFDLEPKQTEQYSPLTLAYIGDCVYELIIRTKLVCQMNAPVDKLNRVGSTWAKAATQSRIIEAVTGMLTDEELAVYKRGKNAHTANRSRSATAGEYRRATGFESMIGYLYIKNEFDRIMEIVKAGFEAAGGKNEIQ